MRSSVKFEVVGSTLHEIVGKATESWREFVGDASAELPVSAEISAERDLSDTYIATVYINTKVEDAK